MFKLKKITSAVCCAVSVSVMSSYAFGIEPESIQAGAFDITPTVDVDYSHTDNMFLSNANEVSSNLFVISPRLEAMLQSGGNSLTLSGEINNADYSATDEDDYTDWRIGAAAHLELSSQSMLDLNAGFFDTREMRGTGFSQGGFLPTAPDSYEETTFGGMFQFGTNESIGRFELSVDSLDKSYSNNRVTTQFRDREDLGWTGTFYFNLSSRTALLVEHSISDVDYTTDPLAVVGSADSLDSDESYTYVGVSWEATSKTTGSLRIGRGSKDFDDSDRKKADGASWKLDVQWEPLSYSVVNITASRDFDEASGVGNALQSKRYGLTWTHNWSDALSSTLSANYSDDEYTASTRNDTLKNYSAKVNYSVQRWLDVYVSASTGDKGSSFSIYDYDESSIAIGFAASL